MPGARALSVAAVAMLAGLALSACGSSPHRTVKPPPPTHATTTAPPPAAERTSNFGAEFSAVFFSGISDAAAINRALGAAAADGLGLARADPLWEFTEPLAPLDGRHTYNWRFDDLLAHDMAAHGFKWIAVLAYAPAWASLDSAHLHGAPRAPADYAAYAGAVAAHYRGQIAAYEIWNEENSSIFWRPRPDPAAYARLYLAARAAIHAADPGVPVLVGGLANDSSFLSDLLAIPGLSRQLDGVAVHPYGANPLKVLARVRDYRLELRSLGAGDVPLYVTEYGWSTRPVGNPTYAPANDQGRLIGEVAQALLRSDCGVRAVVFYAWTTAQRDPSNRDQWYGIAPPSGAPTVSTAAVGGTARALLTPGAPVRLCGS